jgi:hypothetical protein
MLHQKIIRDKVRSSISRDVREIEPINKWINNRRVKWNEHMEQTDGSKLVRKMRNWIPNSGMNLGDQK